MKTATMRKPVPSVVKLGPSRQVVIPKKVHDQLGLVPGTMLEVQVRGGSLVYTPKFLADWEGRQAYLEAKGGRHLSPAFDTADAGAAYLRRRAAKRKPKP